MTNQNNELAIVMSQPAGSVVCTVQVNEGDIETAKIVYNALNNPTHKLADFIGEVIEVKDVLVKAVDIADEATGELSRAPQIVLIAADGTSYFAMSKGVYNSINNAVMVFGSPTWEPAIPFKVVQEKVGRGRMLKLDMV